MQLCVYVRYPSMLGCKGRARKPDQRAPATSDGARAGSPPRGGFRRVATCFASPCSWRCGSTGGGMRPSDALNARNTTVLMDYCSPVCHSVRLSAPAPVRKPQDFWRASRKTNQTTGARPSAQRGKIGDMNGVRSREADGDRRCSWCSHSIRGAYEAAPEFRPESSRIAQAIAHVVAQNSRVAYWEVPIPSTQSALSEASTLDYSCHTRSDQPGLTRTPYASSK